MRVEIDDWLPKEQNCIMIYKLNKSKQLIRPEAESVYTHQNKRLPISKFGNNFHIDESNGMGKEHWNGFKIGNAVSNQQQDFLLIAYEWDKNDSSFVNGGLFHYWKQIPNCKVQNNYFDLRKFLKEANYTILIGNDKLKSLLSGFDNWLDPVEEKEIEFTNDFEQIKELTENKEKYQSSLF